MPEISVVIVNWNAGGALAECVASLRRCPPSRPYEVIVVDNGSTDDSLAAMRGANQGRADLRVVANGRNRGLAAANNQGLMAARGTAILISNPDVVYRPGAVDALWDLLERRPRAAFAMARLLHPDGSLQVCAGDLPTVGEALLGRRGARHRGPEAGFWWHGWAHDAERPIGHGGEACYLVRRLALTEIGPQDDRFRLDWEGLDWSARAREAGWEVWFCPSAEVVHIGGVSITQVPLRWVVASHLGLWRYFAKRRPWSAPLLAPVVAARAVAKALAAMAGVPLYGQAHRGRPPR